MAIKTRIPPLPRDEWTDEARTMFTMFEGPDAYEEGSKSNVFLTLARHPKLGSSFFKYNGRLLLTSKLDVAVRELVILRLAWLYRSPYEWAQHVELSLSSDGKIDPEHVEAYKSGTVDTTKARGVLTPEHIEAVKRGADDPIWTELQAHAIRAVDQCKESGHIEDTTWEVLAREIPEKQLLELIFFMGTYAMLAWVFNAIGLQPEARQLELARDLLGD
ncbi:MAG: carboxymuconolactone decarboxylase family protein [Novosphingobium sp.]